ncbi:uncharacterized protein LOC108116723 [Drosophila eugracilis]|uniref:uncharacterized protein LOC108116723 n=1 Tax=Drosophila eugracilis TaxID=29029 RepID=UPI0007E8AAC8|nr:uncharacterized protein LOC108116723 [Drosophila eugracilis]
MTWKLWMVPLAYLLASSEGSFDECDFMLEDDIPFTLACKGDYSSDMKLNYRDVWVKAGVPYWLWWRKQAGREMLVSFYKSRISPCKNVTLSLNCLHCSHSVDPGLHIRPESIHCFGFSFSYVRELMKHCGLSPRTKIDHVAIHYARLVPNRDIPGQATRTRPWILRLWDLWRRVW